MDYFWTAIQGQPAASKPEAKSGYHVCPPSSEYELALGEVHTKLDDALNFLQRDVGYCLLADARPAYGSGVTLQTDRFVEKRKQKLPREAGPQPAKSSQKVLDLHGDEILMKNPDTVKYAHLPEDLVLVSRFCRLLGEGKEQVWELVKDNEGLFKTVLQGVRLMHLCDYQYPDIVLVLAYGSVYFKTTFAHIGHKMSKHEAAHVCVLLIYLAHGFLLDETCPLRCWHKHIFRKYCTLKVLDAALFRLFQMRTDFGLRVTDEEQKQALEGLGNVVGMGRSRASSTRGSSPGAAPSAVAGG